EGVGRIRYDSKIRSLLDTDSALRLFFEGKTTNLPRFYTDQVREDLGRYWPSLPEGALSHDPNAYLHAQRQATTPDAGSARTGVKVRGMSLGEPGGISRGRAEVASSGPDVGAPGLDRTRAFENPD